MVDFLVCTSTFFIQYWAGFVKSYKMFLPFSCNLIGSFELKKP